MSSQYQDLLSELTDSLSPEEAFVRVCTYVRDIPYQFIGSRDIDSMLQAGAGTCNAKHMLLHELLKGLGYETEYVIDEFQLTDLLAGISSSDPQVAQLRQMATEIEPYYHTYLKVKKNEAWISLDVSFDTPLAVYGFPVDLDWDGTRDMQLFHTPLKTTAVEGSPDAFKKQLVQRESPENKKKRKEFFRVLNSLLESFRSSL